MKDGLNQDIPQRLEKVFAPVPQLKLAVQDLEAAMQRIKSVGHTDAMVDMNFGAMVRLLLLVQREILDSMPFTSCDCRPNEDCEKCLGHLWLNARQYREVLRSQQKLTSQASSKTGGGTPTVASQTSKSASLLYR